MTNGSTPLTSQPVKEIHVVEDYAVTIEVMIRRSDGTELPLSAIGSGGVELLRVAVLLAEDPTSVVLLDEPAAHLHPRAQERLLQHLHDECRGDTGAQYVVISHSPGLLPKWKDGVGAVVRIALGEHDSSRIKVVDTNTIGQLEDLQRLVLAQPEVKAIPFADWVILVSGQTELIVYPVWFAASGKDQEFTSDPHFVNFQGDEQFLRYLRLVDAFGVPWTAIVDGKSFKPVAPASSEPSANANVNKIPLVANQILQVVADGPDAQLLDHAIQSIQVSVDEEPAEWFKRWRGELERCRVVTLANCWHTRRKVDKECDRCGESIRVAADQCEGMIVHGDERHIESVEDAVRDAGFSVARRGQSKPSQAFKILEQQPEPPYGFHTMLTKVKSAAGPELGETSISL